MHKFDYSFLENGKVPASFINTTNSIYLLRGEVELHKTKFSNIFTELEKVAKVESVKSSNEIEGIITTDQRIKDIVNGNSAPLNHNEAEIAGYRDCLNTIHTNYKNIDFSSNTILSLHKQMMSFTDDNGGTFKQENNVIMEIDSSGNRRIRFKPVEAKDTKEAMEQLELAYKDASNNPAISSLLLIPCVILDFLCIHPFSDGNGRMSRLLTLLLLYKAGFDAGKYISFEEQINNTKSVYYSSLEQSSAGWMENQNDYFPFITNFLFTLVKCYQELDKRFAVINSNKITKKGRIEATILNSLTPLSKSDIHAILPDVSPTTIEVTLAKLLKEEKIAKIGNTRSARYLHK